MSSSARGVARVWVMAAVVMAVALVGIEASRAADAATRPNVVVFLIDDLGWADLSCYGSQLHRTPHLDRLAGEGVRFTQAYAACPVCSPTRAALMTGKWPARLNLTDWLPGRGNRPDQKLNRPVIRQELPLEEVTLAEVFQQAGYATGIIGKWHLGGPGFEPARQGFDLNIGGDARGTPQSWFAPYGREAQRMPGLSDAPDGEYLTDRLAAEAERFIEANRTRPFLLYLPHFAVHTPIRAKPDLVAKYPPAGTFAGRQNNPIYAAMMESMDDAVGRVLRRLEELQLADNTVVVFTSDNGGLATVEGPDTPATSNAPLREGKGWLYEGGIRVPLLVKWPGKGRAGVVSDVVTSTVDLFPTLLEIAGLKAEATPDGVSLAGVLTGAGSIERDAIFWHYPHYANQGGPPGAAIRSGEFKLIEYYGSGRRELFQVTKDVGEARNLTAERPELVEQLARRLDDWRRSVDARLPTPNPGYVPNPQAKDGSITIPARTAEVQGIMLRYEPLPHKNTLGFWVRQDDWARFEFTVTTPGRFEVEGLIGCGNGSGGSEVEFELDGQKLPLTIVETGGFQQFVPTKLGTVIIDQSGRYTLTVRALKKPGVAVMDLRQVVLRPVTE